MSLSMSIHAPKLMKRALEPREPAPADLGMPRLMEPTHTEEDDEYNRKTCHRYMASQVIPLHAPKGSVRIHMGLVWSCHRNKCLTRNHTGIQVTDMPRRQTQGTGSSPIRCLKGTTVIRAAGNRGRNNNDVY